MLKTWKYVTIDLETALFADGRKAPPPVCMSVDWGNGWQSLHASGVRGTWWRRGAEERWDPSGLDAESQYIQIAKDPSVMLLGHTLGYDHKVIQAHWERARRWMWMLHEQHRVCDLFLAHKLLLNAQGQLQLDHPPPSNVAALALQFLNKEIDKTDDDSPRYSYQQYMGVPVTEYSTAHRAYSMDDAEVEASLALPLLREWRKHLPELQALWDVPDLLQRSRILLETELKDARGWRTDERQVAFARAAAEARVGHGKKQLAGEGLYDLRTGKKNTHAVQRMVEHAYGKRAVKEAYGDSQVADADAAIALVEKSIAAFEHWLEGELATRSGRDATALRHGAWAYFRTAPDYRDETRDLPALPDLGEDWAWRRDQAMSAAEMAGKPITRQKAEKLASASMGQLHHTHAPHFAYFANLPWATYFGAVPRSKGGGISTNKYTTGDIDDPLVNIYAGFQQADHLLKSVIPMLESGTHSPAHPSTDVLKATGRTSARGFAYQQFSRLGVELPDDLEIRRQLADAFHMPSLLVHEVKDGKRVWEVTHAGIRECCRARPGYLYASSDIGIAELRCLAQVCKEKYGHSRMADLLIQGRKLHIATGAALLGLSYEEGLKRFKAGDKAMKEARKLAKAMNFGLPGGLGPRAFQIYARGFGLELSLDRCKQLKEWWLSMYPEIQIYLNDIGTMSSRSYPEHLSRYHAVMQDPRSSTRIRQEVSWILRWPEIRDTGDQKIFYSQYASRRLRLIEGGRTYTQAANTSFQGLNADITLEAGYRIQRESFMGRPVSRGFYEYSQGSLWGGAEEVSEETWKQEAARFDSTDPCFVQAELYGSRIVALIHDEVLAEVPIFKAELAARRIQYIIEEVMSQYLRDVPPEAGISLSRLWFKDAEERLSETGHLIVHEYPGELAA